MKIELEIDLNDKAKTAAFILFLQACKDAEDSFLALPKEEPVKEMPVKKTTKKAVEKIEVEGLKAEDLKNLKAEVEKIPEAKEDETGDKITIEQIREAFATKVNNGDNRLILKTELSRLGAENLSKLDPSKYAEFLKFIENVQ
jgi:hypothetical protein